MTKREFKSKYVWPLSVSIERFLRKLRIKIDRVYRKIWVYLYILIMLPFFLYGVWHVHYDYKLLSNVANLDTPFSLQYTSWNTDGSPGKEPPK
jgi:hypothetical protein